MAAQNESRTLSRQTSQDPLHRAATLGATIIAALLLIWGTRIMLDREAPRLLVGGVALGVGVCGAWLFFWIGNEIVSRLPNARLRTQLLPLVFIGPALLVLLVYLIYPTLNTVWLSLMDARSEQFVGLENYRFAFTNADIQTAFRNNYYWLVLVTLCSVSLGLIIAVLVDRVRHEAIAKSFIFLPLAISFVGASVIWRFVYAFSPAGRPQIGLLNAIVVALGSDPVGWLITRPLNNLALIVIMIWLQTGFCMVVLSAALKAIPSDIFEAARIDGASELQIFFRITIPVIRGTILTVATTVLIAVLKVFDVVFVMTSGQYGTEVLANRMYTEMFKFRNFGHGSAIAVILLVMVIPVMVINVRNLRRQRREA